MAGQPGDDDVPSPINFHDPAQARAWETDTIARRPWRPKFFAGFADELNAHFADCFQVLELGSGPGHLAEAILTRCAVTQYCALDFSDAMHALARQRLKALASKMQFITGDFRLASWTEGLGSFDAILTLQAAHELRHIRRLPALLSQIRSVLSPNGLFLYSDHYAEGGQNPKLVLARSEQSRVLENAGFSRVRRLLDKRGMALYSAHGA